MYSYRGNPDLVYTSGLSVLATAYAVCLGVRSSHKVQADRPCQARAERDTHTWYPATGVCRMRAESPGTPWHGCRAGVWGHGEADRVASLEANQHAPRGSDAKSCLARMVCLSTTAPPRSALNSEL